MPGLAVSVPDGPLTRGDAARLGIPISALLGREYRRVFHGVYVPAAEPDSTLLRARAALRVAPDGVMLSHHTAAELWGGIVPHQSQIHLSVGSSSRWAGPAGVAVHSRSLTVPSFAHHGVRLAGPEVTFLDLAGELDLVDLVVLGDSLIGSRRTSTERITMAVNEFHGRGAKIARRAAALTRAGVDSPTETKLRLLIVLAGLPEPVVNFVIYNPDGSWRHRCDLAWPELKIAVEYDGRQHAENDQQWASDIARREAFDSDGWRIIVVRSPDLYQTPARTLERILTVREQRGARHPRRFQPQWRRHFLGHLPVAG